MTFSEKLALLTERRGIKKKHLAEAVGVDPSRVSDWLGDKSLPTFKQAVEVARCLGVSLDYLADEDANEPPAAWSMDPADARKLTQAAEVIIRLVRVETSDHSAIAPPVVAGPVSDVPRRAGKQNTG